MYNHTTKACSSFPKFIFGDWCWKFVGHNKMLSKSDWIRAVWSQHSLASMDKMNFTVHCCSISKVWTLKRHHCSYTLLFLISFFFFFFSLNFYSVIFYVIYVSAVSTNPCSLIWIQFCTLNRNFHLRPKYLRPNLH